MQSRMLNCFRCRPGRMRDIVLLGRVCAFKRLFPCLDLLFLILRYLGDDQALAWSRIRLLQITGKEVLAALVGVLWPIMVFGDD